LWQRTVALATLLLGAGCGSDDGDVPRDCGCPGIDASPDADDDAGSARMIPIHADTSDTVVAVQDGDGPWQAVTFDANDDAVVAIESATYAVAMLCPEIVIEELLYLDNSTVAYVTAPPDGGHVLDCRTYEPGPVHGVTIEGTPGTQITIGVGSYTIDESGTLLVEAREGTSDVWGFLPGDPARFKAYSGLDIQAETALEFDMDVVGEVMPTQTPTVIGPPDTQIYSELGANDFETYAFFGYAETTVPVPPTAQLSAGYHPTIGASGGGCVRQLPVMADAPTLELPAPLTAEVAAGSTSFVAAPELAWTDVFVSLRSPASPPTAKRQNISATAAWFEATGATSIPTVDVETLPNAPPSVESIKPGDAVRYSVRAWRGDNAGDYTGCTGTGTVTW
jgi:hypothetical protein